MCVYLLGVFTLRDLSSVCDLIIACLGVVVFYLRTSTLLINVLLNRPNIILTIIILILSINQSMCAEWKLFGLKVLWTIKSLNLILN